MTWPWIHSSVTRVGMWFNTGSCHPCQAGWGDKPRVTAVVCVASRRMDLPALTCASSSNFFQKQRLNRAISLLFHKLQLCISSLCKVEAKSSSVPSYLSNLLTSISRKQTYMLVFTFFPPPQKDFKFSLIIYMSVVFCSGDVVLESLSSSCESAAPCDTPGSCFPIPGENSGFRLCCVMITSLFPWPPTQQNNSQVFVKEGLMGLFCIIGGASLRSL